MPSSFSQCETASEHEGLYFASVLSTVVTFNCEQCGNSEHSEHVTTVGPETSTLKTYAENTPKTMFIQANKLHTAALKCNDFVLHQDQIH